uniref:Uncharacterized protein n=1 Tax=Anguilla anguilla TaxID=7936 RepID=A0A0E9PXR0_ANGAN
MLLLVWGGCGLPHASLRYMWSCQPLLFTYQERLTKPEVPLPRIELGGRRVLLPLPRLLF